MEWIGWAGFVSVGIAAVIMGNYLAASIAFFALVFSWLHRLETSLQKLDGVEITQPIDPAEVRRYRVENPGTSVVDAIKAIASKNSTDGEKNI
ncbi:hypothetical protein [Corynebacterium sp.]|uniref:hypothetical protein n=1 Tax=Corynebacterium sp. TaxID=1720 RepID=UPI0026DBC4EC|nr:hypothetical protein [Corynebacterium sp.]